MSYLSSLLNNRDVKKRLRSRNRGSSFSFGSPDPASIVEAQNLGLQEQIYDLGFDQVEETPKRGAIETISDLLSVGNYASANVFANLLGQETPGRQWAKEQGWTGAGQEIGSLFGDVGGAVKFAFTGENPDSKRTFEDVLEAGSPRLGWEGWKKSGQEDWNPSAEVTESGFTPKGFLQTLGVAMTSPGFGKDVARSATGTALDIALDPTNYMDFGMDDIARAGNKLLGEAQQAGKVLPNLRINTPRGSAVASRIWAENTLDEVAKAGKFGDEIADALNQGKKVTRDLKGGADYLSELRRIQREQFRSINKGSKSVAKFTLPGMQPLELLSSKQWEKTGIPQAVESVIGVGGHKLPEDVLGMPIFRDWKDQFRYNPAGALARTVYAPGEVITTDPEGKIKVLKPDVVETPEYTNWKPAGQIQEMQPVRAGVEGQLDRAYTLLIGTVGERKANEMIERIPQMDLFGFVDKDSTPRTIMNRITSWEPPSQPLDEDGLVKPFLNMPEPQKVVNVKGEEVTLHAGPYQIYDEGDRVVIKDGIQATIPRENVGLIRGEFTDQVNAAGGGKLYDESDKPIKFIADDEVNYQDFILGKATQGTRFKPEAKELFDRIGVKGYITDSDNTLIVHERNVKEAIRRNSEKAIFSLNPADQKNLFLKNINDSLNINSQNKSQGFSKDVGAISDGDLNSMATAMGKDGEIKDFTKVVSVDDKGINHILKPKHTDPNLTALPLSKQDLDFIPDIIQNPDHLLYKNQNRFVFIKYDGNGYAMLLDVTVPSKNRNIYEPVINTFYKVKKSQIDSYRVKYREIGGNAGSSGRPGSLNALNLTSQTPQVAPPGQANASTPSLGVQTITPPTPSNIPQTPGINQVPINPLVVGLHLAEPGGFMQKFVSDLEEKISKITSKKPDPNAPLTDKEIEDIFISHDEPTPKTEAEQKLELQRQQEIEKNIEGRKFDTEDDLTGNWEKEFFGTDEQKLERAYRQKKDLERQRDILMDRYGYTEEEYKEIEKLSKVRKGKEMGKSDIILSAKTKKKPLEFDYTNKDGIKSQRKVNILGQKGKLVFTFDVDAKQKRTFNADNMENIHLEGEPILKPEEIAKESRNKVKEFEKKWGKFKDLPTPDEINTVKQGVTPEKKQLTPIEEAQGLEPKPSTKEKLDEINNRLSDLSFGIWDLQQKAHLNGIIL